VPTATPETRSTRAVRSAPDALCSGAVDLARAAAVEEAGDPRAVGDHLGVVAEPRAERVVTHRFACLVPAYVGWTWAVTVARASRAKVVTVDEVVLLPGEGALLAPEWLPWSERVQPGDLAAGGLLPTAPDDARLVPSYGVVSEPASDTQVVPEPYDADLHWSLGLGRPRVLSPEGREDAAERWYGGDRGPDAEIARQAPGRCGGCGFLVPLAGDLRQVFGVCANSYAPDDGRVVSLDHGCGAHSEAVPLPPAAEVPPPVPAEDDLEVVALRGDSPDARTGHGPGSVDDDAEAGEPFGHS
jgi:hypothetical protein